MTAARAAAWLLPLAVAGLLVAGADFWHRPALVFPAGAALLLGAGVAGFPFAPVSGGQLATVPPMCALIGVTTERLGLPPVAAQLLALTAGMGIILATGCPALSALSAAMLPVVFGVRDWIYPAVVLAVSCVAASLVPATPAEVRRWSWTRAVAFWLPAAGWLCAAGLVLGLPAVAVAPPLLVSGLSWTLVRPHSAGQAARRLALIAIAGGYGALALQCAGSRWQAALFAAGGALILVWLCDEPHPPVLTAALVPFVANAAPGQVLLSMAVGGAAIYLGSCAGVRLLPCCFRNVTERHHCDAESPCREEQRVGWTEGGMTRERRGGDRSYGGPGERARADPPRRL